MITDDRNDQSQFSTGWLDGRQITVAEMKVGQLLVEAGIISPASLDSAIEMAAVSHELLETVLVHKFYLSEQTMKNVHKANAMLDAQLVERDAVFKALFTTHTNGADFSDAIAEVNGGVPELEHLLVQSKMVSALQLKEAKRFGKERGLQIGASLYRMKVVSFIHLNYALDCLYLVKENRLTMSRAVIALAEVKLTNCNLQTALGEAPTNNVKVGELLLGGRVINEVDMLKGIEEAIASQRLIGALLVESGLVSDGMLKEVLLLQGLCSKGVLDQRSAVRILRKSVETGEGVRSTASALNVFADDERLTQPALGALIKAGFVSHALVSEAQSNFESLNMGPLKSLVAYGFICATARRAALECAELTLRNIITESEAVKVLHYCDRHDVDFEEAFAKLGISRVEDSRRMQALAISNEFKLSRSFPKLLKSLYFFLPLLIAVVAIVGMIALKVLVPGQLSTFGISALAAVAVVIVIRIRRSWKASTKQHKIETEAKLDTARVTVTRLKSRRSQVKTKRSSHHKAESENYDASRV